MCHLLADIYTHDVVAVAAVNLIEVLVHLFFCTERLDDAQAAQRFFYHTHRIAPKCLCLDTVCLQFLAHYSHKPAERWYKENGEEGKLPTDADQRNEIEEDQDRVLEEHVERRHDAAFYLAHVARHTCNDVALALFAEEAQRKRGNLLVELVADIANNTRTDRDDGG